MAKKQGDTHLALIQRRDRVKQLVIHQARLSEIAQALNISEQTVRTDVQAIFEEWRKDIEVKERWNHAAAFDRLDELDRQYWAIFHQAPRQIPVGKHMLLEDRSQLKAGLLDSMHDTLKTRNLMAGIGTARVFEQIRYLESEKARGFEFTRISYEEQKKQGVEMLRKDLEWQRREGLIREQPATKT